MLGWALTFLIIALVAAVLNDRRLELGETRRNDPS